MKIEECDLCPNLVCSRNQIVSGFGSGITGVMFIGEAPGQKGSNISGEPFSFGRSGFLFNYNLKKFGIKKKDCYTTNIVKCSPPGNRPPEDEEIKNCVDHLIREIIIYKPKIIVTVGNVAKETVNIYILRNNLNIKYFHLYHPGYILRNGKPAKEWYEKEFKKLKELIE